MLIIKTHTTDTANRRPTETSVQVLLLMDGCSSHGELVDDRGQVTVKCLPPLCTAVHQPMDLGVIAKTKVNYRKELLDVKASTCWSLTQLAPRRSPAR